MRTRCNALAAIAAGAMVAMAGCGGYAPGRTYALASPAALWPDPSIFDADYEEFPTAGHLIDEYHRLMGARGPGPGGMPAFVAYSLDRATLLRDGDAVRVLGRAESPGGVGLFKVSVERSSAAEAGAVGYVVADGFEAVPAD